MIISVNQLCIYGAVSDLCGENKSSHVRTGRPVLAGQSDPLFEPTSSMKTPAPSTDDPAQEDLLQKYQERVERVSQQNRAGFLTTVGVGLYFMTKDTEEFSQFTESMAFREYTGYGQLSPNYLWPKPSLAKPSLAKSKFGQTNCGGQINHFWPK